MNRTDISNNLFAAIDVIVEKKLATLAFDRTVIVKIIGEKDERSRYKVEYLNGILYAYCDNGYEYKLNNMAYMLIPQNDISNDLLLLGPVAYYRTEIKEDNTNG